MWDDSNLFSEVWVGSDVSMFCQLELTRFLWVLD